MSSEAAAPPSAVLSGAQASTCERWQQPEVGQGGAAGRMLTARELEALRQAAYREAFEQGYAAGLAEAGAEARRLVALMHALARPFEQLDERVEDELVALAIAIARQLIRRELQTDHGQIVAVVREALSVLPVAARDIRLQLHPADAALVQRLLAPAESQPAWQIVEDPTLSRGGCVVSSESSRVDARLETRIGAIVSSVLGGGRIEDRLDHE